jgi:hypothetical protein
MNGCLKRFGAACAVVFVFACVGPSRAEVGGSVEAKLLEGRNGKGSGKEQAPRSILLSQRGGDRATAYVMSNKIARRDGLLLCTWLDVDRQNRWALVDPRQARVVREGAVGQPQKDNHCGAAVAADLDGTWHLLVGAHHGSFAHYRMAPNNDHWESIEDGRSIGQAATYPSLVCDAHGTLHLTYRYEPGGRDACVYYARRPKGGRWSEPRALMRCAVSEHSWLTGAIEVGPEGRLHVVVSNTLPVPEVGPGARYYGASHLYSDDSGRSWRQFGDAEPLALPAPGAGLRRIEGDTMEPARIEADYGGAPGPLHSYYHKILLSNVAVDDQARPWVVVHNLLEGTAQLYRHEVSAGWVGVSLTGAVRSVLPGFHVRHCGQLSRRRDGTIEVVLMVAPLAERAWGTKGTELVRLLVGPDGSLRRSDLVRRPDPDMPHWLPSIERWCWQAPVERPALMYTRGVNVGGYSQNRNRVETEVWLQLP